MEIKDYNQLSSLELDTLREVGSIGTGNAATALSSLIGEAVRIQMPEVRIMGYNEAIEWIGGPEEITAGVLVGMGGHINGIMLSVQQLDFVNLVLGNMMGRSVNDYAELGEIERSALVEVGNIMISTFISALSGLAGIEITLTVPAFTVDIWRAIGLHHDHWRQLRVSGQRGALPAVAVAGYPVAECAFEKARRQQLKCRRRLEIFLKEVRRYQWRQKSQLALPI